MASSERCFEIISSSFNVLSSSLFRTEVHHTLLAIIENKLLLHRRAVPSRFSSRTMKLLVVNASLLLCIRFFSLLADDACSPVHSVLNDSNESFPHHHNNTYIICIQLEWAASHPHLNAAHNFYAPHLYGTYMQTIENRASTGRSKWIKRKNSKDEKSIFLNYGVFTNVRVFLFAREWIEKEMDWQSIRSVCCCFSLPLSIIFLLYSFPFVFFVFSPLRPNQWKLWVTSGRSRSSNHWARYYFCNGTRPRNRWAFLTAPHSIILCKSFLLQMLRTHQQHRAVAHISVRHAAHIQSKEISSTSDEWRQILIYMECHLRTNDERVSVQQKSPQHGESSRIKK